MLDEKKAENGIEEKEIVVDVDEENSGELETEDGEQKSTDDQVSEEEKKTDDDQQDDEDDLVVSIGEETPPQEDETAKAPAWVKELRKTNREKDKRIRELEARINQTTEKKPVELGTKPKLEDFDYDAEKYEAELSTWYERKRIFDVEKENAKKAEDAQKQAWQAKLDGYAKAKKELRVKDYDDAELFAQDIFSITQQGIILQGADNPALMTYALYKNSKKAQELSKIDDPVKFSFAVAKLEKDLKVSSRSKTKPEPERILTGNGRTSGTVDSTLNRLRTEAEKTGDYSKVVQYRNQQRAKAKK